MADAGAAKGGIVGMPRWSLALACVAHAGVLGWAAVTLPWSYAAPFAVAASALCVGHVLTAALAAARSRSLPNVWLGLCVSSLAFFAWCVFQIAATASILVTLYGSLGRGFNTLFALSLAPIALFTVPLSLWGIALCGSAAGKRRLATAALAILIFAAAGAWWAAASRRSAALPTGASPSELASRVAKGLPRWRDLPQPPRSPRSRSQNAALDASGPADCERPPTDPAARATVVLRYLAAGSRRIETRTECLQGDPEELPGRIGSRLAASALRAPAKIDWLTGARPLREGTAPTALLELRPGLDGVCVAERCLMPWQLVLADRFNALTPWPYLPDLRFGFDPGTLRSALRGAAVPEGGRLTAIEVASFAVDRWGELRELRRLRTAAKEIELGELTVAGELAERHIALAQRPTGVFRYLVDPVSSRKLPGRFSIQRQAGTTLALCELGRDRERVARIARRSLTMLAALERRAGDVSGLVRNPAGAEARIGNAALPLIALLSCRPRVGPRFDELTARLGRLLLALQRPDGGFHPRYDLVRGQAVPGGMPLYSEGQAVFALTLLEEHVANGRGGTSTPLPAYDRVRDAVERAMRYFAESYWSHPLADFFYVEENWHCLAARAALGHHRNDAYERFCIDYTAFRSRLILDEEDGISPDFLGGFGFGNLFPPQNMPTAGYVETLAAAMAVKRARGADLAPDRILLRRSLRFLLRQQWTGATCFACSRSELIVGGFSESMTSPRLRIDYTQHAWAAIGHAARLLYPDADRIGAPDRMARDRDAPLSAGRS